MPAHCPVFLRGGGGLLPRRASSLAAPLAAQALAAAMAFLVLAYMPQRQMLVIEPSMSASVGFGLRPSKAAAAMIIPGWQ